MNTGQPSRAASFLWRAYGHVYDALLDFWPYRHLLDQVADRLELARGTNLLDLGCGTGNLIGIGFQRAQIRATGVDVSESMLAVASRKLGAKLDSDELQLHQSDLISYLSEVPAESFDAIGCVNVVYALEDRTILWQEVLRVLKPSGRLVLTTSIKPGSIPIIREHFRHAGLSQLLSFKMLSVFVIDGLINLFGRAGHFPFASAESLKVEIAHAGGKWIDQVLTYGGEEHGVNILVTITK